MAFTISEFREAFSTGIARPNLWHAELTNTNANLLIPSKFKFRCERAEIPGRTVATVDDTGSGPTLKLPYEITYNDIEITIICANDMEERKYFEKWIDVIVGNKNESTGGGLISYYSLFAKGNTLKLSQLDDLNAKKITYTLHDIYPIGISPMNLSWEETNTYQRFNVTMNYRCYVVE